jgi:hypothetical protein
MERERSQTVKTQRDGLEDSNAVLRAELTTAELRAVEAREQMKEARERHLSVGRMADHLADENRIMGDEMNDMRAEIKRLKEDHDKVAGDPLATSAVADATAADDLDLSGGNDPSIGGSSDGNDTTKYLEAITRLEQRLQFSSEELEEARINEEHSQEAARALQARLATIGDVNKEERARFHVAEAQLEREVALVRRREGGGRDAMNLESQLVANYRPCVCGLYVVWRVRCVLFGQILICFSLSVSLPFQNHPPSTMSVEYVDSFLPRPFPPCAVRWRRLSCRSGRVDRPS